MKIKNIRLFGSTKRCFLENILSMILTLGEALGFESPEDIGKLARRII